MSDRMRISKEDIQILSDEGFGVDDDNTPADENRPEYVDETEDVCVHGELGVEWDRGSKEGGCSQLETQNPWSPSPHPEGV